MLEMKLIDAGYSEVQAAWGLIVELETESWFIPTDQPTAEGMARELNKTPIIGELREHSKIA